MMKNPLSKILIILFIFSTIMACTQKQDTYYQGYVEGRLRFITAEFSGQITQMMVRRGDTVKVGDQLFLLENQPETYQSQALTKKIAELKQLINELNARVKLTQAIYQRRTALFKMKHISEEELNNSEADYQQALLKVEQAKEQLNQTIFDFKKSQWQLNKKIIISSLAGYVFDTFYNVGEFVSSNSPVLAILPPKDIRMIFYIPVGDLSKIKLGQRVWINCDNCQQSIPATVDFISTSAEYTSPLIYSLNTPSKLVFRIEAYTFPSYQILLRPGQPIYVYLNRQASEKQRKK